MRKHGKTVIIDKIKFKSIGEAERYTELKLLERAGKITNLQVHPRFTLFPGYYLKDKDISWLFSKKQKERNWMREATCELDFSYNRPSEKRIIVEDVKSKRALKEKEKRYVIKESWLRGIRIFLGQYQETHKLEIILK